MLATFARGATGLVVAALVLAGAAAPATAPAATTGPEGQRLTVSKATDLSPDGETVTVDGVGYDQRKGIYVAFCVDNGPAEPATPCGGGVDTSGSLGASRWISSDPPSYGDDLAQPYGEDGSFRVALHLTSVIGDVDCTRQACAVVTRTDHTRNADRSQDVRIPVSFADQSSAQWWLMIVGVLVVVLLGSLAAGLLIRRRSSR